MNLDLDSMTELSRRYQVALERHRTVRSQIDTDAYIGDMERVALDATDLDLDYARRELFAGWAKGLMNT